MHESISPSILPESLGGTLSEENAWDTQVIANLWTKEDYYKGK